MLRSFDLVIFDMDETLVASAPVWRQAEMRLYDLLGRPYSADASNAYKGMNAMDVGRTIHAICGVDGAMAPDDCGRVVREALIQGFADGTEPMPGADALVRYLVGRADLVVASGSPLPAIEGVLRRLGWSECFRLLVSSEEVERGKPSPDVFLEAARRAGCSPSRSLVLEDSLHGVRAAKRAGMSCFVTPSSDDPRIVEEADAAYPTLAALLDELRPS